MVYIIRSIGSFTIIVISLIENHEIAFVENAFCDCKNESVAEGRVTTTADVTLSSTENSVSVLREWSRQRIFSLLKKEIKKPNNDRWTLQVFITSISSSSNTFNQLFIISSRP
jgi:Na+-transporting NADH:ubiquinone oxidoreductase subunit NqrA